MTYYAGLDVSLRTVNLCVIDAEGHLNTETKLPSDVIELVAWLDGLGLEDLHLGLEAGTLAQYLTYGLQSAGYIVVCMETRHVNAALSAMRNKTDKNDARDIAQLLRCSGYRPVHVKSMASHQIRFLLSSRKAALAKCVDLENEIRGLFKVSGIKLPPKFGHGSFDAAVRDIIEADANLSQSLLPLLDARLVLYQTFRELDNRTRHVAEADPVCQRLMTAPGEGFVTALTYKAGVDDPTRFRRSRTVAAQCGLTPPALPGRKAEPTSPHLIHPTHHQYLRDPLQPDLATIDAVRQGPRRDVPNEALAQLLAYLAWVTPDRFTALSRARRFNVRKREPILSAGHIALEEMRWQFSTQPWLFWRVWHCRFK